MAFGRIGWNVASGRQDVRDVASGSQNVQDVEFERWNVRRVEFGKRYTRIENSDKHNTVGTQHSTSSNTADRDEGAPGSPHVIT